MPLGIVGRTDPGIRQVVGFGDRSTGRGNFGVEFGARHCNKWGFTFAATWPSSRITLGRLVIVVVPETVVGEDQNGSGLHGGRISACSYRSYLSYDELTPDSLLNDRLSLVSGRTSTTPGPNIALVTPNGTLYRLTDPSFQPRNGAPSNDRGPTGIVPDGPAPSHEDDLPLEVSVELDDVFMDEDPAAAVNDSETSSTSVFDFAVACLRRQRPDKLAVVRATFHYRATQL